MASRHAASGTVQTRGSRQESATQFVQMALSTGDLQTLTNEAANLAARILQVEYAEVFKLLPDGGSLLLESGAGWERELVGQVAVEAGPRSQAGYALESNTPVIVGDLRTERRFGEAPLLLNHGIVSGINVVITSQGRPYGVLSAHTTRRREFTTSDIHVLQGIANSLSGAIELRQVEDQLRLANSYNRSLIEASLDPLVTIDAQGKITDANTAAEKVRGYPRSELIGSDFASYFTEPEKAKAGYQQVFRDGSVRDLSLEIQSRDGRITPVLYNASLYRDETGKVLGIFAAARDVSELKRTERQLRLANSYNRSLLEASLDPLVTIDPRGKITDANRSAEEVTGYPRGELIGTDFLDYFTEPEKARAGYQQVFREGLVRDYPLEIRSREGRTTPVLYNASVYRDEAGKVLGIFAAARDVTEIRRVEQEIRKLSEDLEQRVLQRTAELQAANEELEAFSYSVSHDLRAPLRSIDGFSRILQEEHSAELSPEAKRYLRLVRESAQQMGHLVDDLLAFSRLGHQSMALQTVWPAVLIRQALVELQIEQVNRKVEITVGDQSADPKEALPACRADPALLKQVWVNLVSNALKFTRRQSVAWIEIGAKQAGGECVYYIKDNGVGFDMQYADKLFGVFQRLHRTEDFEGTGVGLATVQRIVHRHGGRAWAEAEVDKGATFYFTLGRRDSNDPK